MCQNVQDGKIHYNTHIVERSAQNMRSFQLVQGMTIYRKSCLFARPPVFIVKLLPINKLTFSRPHVTPHVRPHVRPHLRPHVRPHVEA